MSVEAPEKPASGGQLKSEIKALKEYILKLESENDAFKAADGDTRILDRLKHDLRTEYRGAIQALEEEITNLKSENEGLKALSAKAVQAVADIGALPELTVVDERPYPMRDIFANEQDPDAPNPKAGHVYEYRSTYPESGEWVFVKTIDCHNDTGYGKQIGERVLAMAKSAVGVSNNILDFNRVNAATMPPFNPANKVEVRVRIIPAVESQS